MSPLLPFRTDLAFRLDESSLRKYLFEFLDVNTGIDFSACDRVKIDLRTYEVDGIAYPFLDGHVHGTFQTDGFECLFRGILGDSVGNDGVQTAY